MSAVPKEVQNQFAPRNINSGVPHAGIPQESFAKRLAPTVPVMRPKHPLGPRPQLAPLDFNRYRGGVVMQTGYGRNETPTQTQTRVGNFIARGGGGTRMINVPMNLPTEGDLEMFPAQLGNLRQRQKRERQSSRLQDEQKAESLPLKKDDMPLIDDVRGGINAEIPPVSSSSSSTPTKAGTGEEKIYQDDETMEVLKTPPRLSPKAKERESPPPPSSSFAPDAFTTPLSSKATQALWSESNQDGTPLFGGSSSSSSSSTTPFAKTPEAQKYTFANASDEQLERILVNPKTPPKMLERALREKRKRRKPDYYSP